MEHQETREELVAMGVGNTQPRLEVTRLFEGVREAQSTPPQPLATCRAPASLLQVCHRQERLR